MLNKKLAFPSGIESEPNGGLTRKELFAAMAMQGLLANPNITEACITEDNKLYLDSAENISEIAVDCADKLIENLDKQENPNEKI